MNTVAEGKLEPVTENLWWTALDEGATRRSMVLARRRDGDLVVHDPIAPSLAGARELEAIGVPRYLVVSGAARHLDARAFKERYPKVQVFTPRGSADTLAKVVHVDGIYEDFPVDEDVRLEMLHGVGDTNGALLVTSLDGVTLVLDDAVLEGTARPGPLGVAWALLRGRGPQLRLSRLFKLCFAKNQRALRRDLERFAELPELVRLVACQRVTTGTEAVKALKKAALALGKRRSTRA